MKNFWLKAVSLENMQPGDIIVYISKHYNPNPEKREKGTPSGTHIALVDACICHGKNSSTITVIDATNRPYCRSLSPTVLFENGSVTFKTSTKLPRGSAAYSLMKITPAENENNLFTIQITGLKVFDATLHVLRIDKSQGKY